MAIDIGAYCYTVSVSYMTVTPRKPVLRKVKRKTILGNTEVREIQEQGPTEVIRRKVKRVRVVADTAAQACAHAEFVIRKQAFPIEEGGKYYISTKIISMRPVGGG